MKRYLQGYIIISDNRTSEGYRKVAFKIETRNKVSAYKQLKEKYPNGRIYFHK
jgi:hypothetical protein